MYDYYKSAEWEAIKTAAIAAADGNCEFCGKPAETAHHVRYPKTLGTEEPRELIAVCWKCHGLIHGKRGQVHDNLDGILSEVAFNIVAEGFRLEDWRGAIHSDAERRDIVCKHLASLLLWALRVGPHPSLDELWAESNALAVSASTDIEEHLRK